MLLACLFVLPAGFSNQAFAEEQIKSSALQNNETELNRPLPFTNDFSVTAEGEFAKDKAAEMLERYPELNANPYAILVEFQPDADDKDVQELLADTNSQIVDFYPTVN